MPRRPIDAENNDQRRPVRPNLGLPKYISDLIKAIQAHRKRNTGFKPSQAELVAEWAEREAERLGILKPKKISARADARAAILT